MLRGFGTQSFTSKNLKNSFDLDLKYLLFFYKEKQLSAKDLGEGLIRAFRDPHSKISSALNDFTNDERMELLFKERNFPILLKMYYATSIQFSKLFEKNKNLENIFLYALCYDWQILINKSPVSAETLYKVLDSNINALDILACESIYQQIREHTPPDLLLNLKIRFAHFINKKSFYINDVSKCNHLNFSHQENDFNYFPGIIISSANFNYGILLNPNFIKANLENIVFTNARIINGEFKEAILTQANLSGAILEGNYSAADFSNANLTKTVLSGNFNNAIFHGAYLNSTTISEKCNLQGADFSRATLDGTYSQVNFSKTKLIKTTLKGNFSKANFQKADLTSCMIDKECNFIGADFLTAIVDDATQKSIYSAIKDQLHLVDGTFTPLVKYWQKEMNKSFSWEFSVYILRLLSTNTIKQFENLKNDIPTKFTEKKSIFNNSFSTALKAVEKNLSNINFVPSEQKQFSKR